MNEDKTIPAESFISRKSFEELLVCEVQRHHTLTNQLNKKEAVKCWNEIMELIDNYIKFYKKERKIK